MKKETSTGPVDLRFESIASGSDATLAILSLNRPESANAFNAQVMESITSLLEQVRVAKGVRALVLSGRGKHFSAGADLAWMQASACLDYDENLRDAEKLTRMFEALATIPVPTIGLIQGAAFGGAVGLAACCDIVIAYETAKFCLSEVKLGILPAVIYPYLAKKINPGQLARLSLTARIFSGIVAKEIGLAQLICNEESMQAVLRDEINGLLAAGPGALERLKVLQGQVAQNGSAQGQYTARAIAEARIAAEAQSGFQAFFGKQLPPWFLELDKDWKFNA